MFSLEIVHPSEFQQWIVNLLPKPFCERHFVVKLLPTKRSRKSVAYESTRKEQVLFTGGQIVKLVFTSKIV
jgi:hypothetical protein